MLSPRLKLIYDCIQPGQPMWDIGCDHGYLGLFAFSEKHCSSVNLVDQSKAVIQKLNHKVAELWPEGPGDQLKVWHQDAEQQALPIDGGTVVISGMGIWTMLQIMARNFPDVANSKVNLVLACALNEPLLRVNLRRKGWLLQREELFIENKKVRQLLVCSAHGQPIEPFWNASFISFEHQLLQDYLADQNAYFSVNQSTDPDLVFLKDRLQQISPDQFGDTVTHDKTR